MREDGSREEVDVVGKVSYPRSVSSSGLGAVWCSVDALTHSFLASLSQVLTPAVDNMADQLRTAICGVCDTADALDHNASSDTTIKLIAQLHDTVDRFVEDTRTSVAQKNPPHIRPFNVSFSTSKSRDNYYKMKLNGDRPASASHEEWPPREELI